MWRGRPGLHLQSLGSPRVDVCRALKVSWWLVTYQHTTHYIHTTLCRQPATYVWVYLWVFLCLTVAGWSLMWVDWHRCGGWVRCSCAVVKHGVYASLHHHVSLNSASLPVSDLSYAVCSYYSCAYFLWLCCLGTSLNHWGKHDILCGEGPFWKHYKIYGKFADWLSKIF